MRTLATARPATINLRFPLHGYRVLAAGRLPHKQAFASNALETLNTERNYWRASRRRIKDYLRSQQMRHISFIWDSE